MQPRLFAAALAAVLLLLAPAEAQAQTAPRPAESNVIYGMASGAALLMDVYQPGDGGLGIGVIFIPGSAWRRPLDYDSRGIKQAVGVHAWTTGVVRDLVDHGFTVFVINHRSAPGFRFPVPLEDARRAARFVRHNADRFGVDPDRLAAMGHSSGGNLAAMLGVTDEAPGPGTGAIEDLPFRVQAVVTLAAPFDFLTDDRNPYGAMAVTNYLGHDWTGQENWRLRATPAVIEAAPVSHVTADDAPFFILYSEDDPVVPVSQAQSMIRALEAAGVAHRVHATPDGEHEPPFPAAAVADWLVAVLGE